MTPKEAQEMFNKEFIKTQREMIFPQDKLPGNYNAWKIACFQFVSLFELRDQSKGFSVNWNDYTAILMKEQGYSYYEVFIINALLEHRTVAEMTPLICGDNFFDVQKAIIEINKEWVAGLKPEEERIIKRIEIMSVQKGAYKEPGALQFQRGGQA